jgi:glycine/D-amino acid oxidase-like deaminating enzyme
MSGREDRDFGLWGETAAPGPPTPPLDGDLSTDVAVIGAGYTGLSTAIHLAERGVGAVVVEAEAPGYGASGRNGGQVLPGFKTYPDHLVRRHGPDLGARMAAFGAGMADELFALVRRHAIACDAVQAGWVHSGTTPDMAAEQRWKHDQWASRGAPVRWLDRDAMRTLLGTDAYSQGWLDGRGGIVQPLSYARGLARAAVSLGVRVAGGTPALSLEPDGGGWRVRTPRGVVRAGRVVVATNGYTGGLVPGLAATVVAVESAQTATEPLPPDLAERVVPAPVSTSDTRRSLLYFRKSPDGRFVIGGRGGILLPTREPSWERLRRLAVKLFPDLAGVRWTHRWSGRLAATMDHMPKLHEPAPGLIASLGCNGRGVAYSTAMGRVIAERIAGLPDADMPVPVDPVEPMPFAPFRRAGAAAVAGWYGLRDRLRGE